MKRIINILCAAAALLTGLWACQKSEGSQRVIDLRYKANDSYEVSARGALPFTIQVASTDTWTVTSAHPEWCIISEEQGEGADPELVHTGKAEATTIRIQYYDNTELDEREDQITIQSDYWVGKVIKVRQGGIAYLTVPETDLAQNVGKPGGNFTIHVDSNQNWSAKVTEGDWLSVSEGATGSLVGDVTILAADNNAEKRYGSVTIFDRHDKPMYIAKFTQEGLQLDLADTKVHALYDDKEATIHVISNASWVVSKASEADDWFTIESPTGAHQGDGDIVFKFTQNDDDALRKAEVVVKNVVTQEGDYLAEKTIAVKQAAKVVPQRYYLDDDEMSLWESDQSNRPVYTKGVGTFFNYPCRLHRSDMPMGTYTFCWSNIETPPTGNIARARHWFCFGESAELKCDIRPFDDGGKIGFSFNKAGDDNEPSPSSIYGIDFSQPVALTIEFQPNGVFYTDPETGDTVEYCHVQFYVNGESKTGFDTSRSLFRTCYWGAKINLYVGMYQNGSGICEWYEYSAPIDWGK